MISMRNLSQGVGTYLLEDVSGIINSIKIMRILHLGLLKVYMVEELGIKLFRNTLLIRNFKITMINSRKTQQNIQLLSIVN